MAVRYDLGELRSPHTTHDGMLLCEATFARDGVLEYRLPGGGVRRELRRPEENKKALTSFGIAPVTIEHPPVLLTEDNSEAYRKGISLQDVEYGKGGYVKGVVALMDSMAIDYATKEGGAEISAGYTCNIKPTPGVWKGQHYDCEQVDLVVNHLALTKRGRAGPEVRLHLDSADEDFAYQTSTPKPRMATLRIDSVEYTDVPELLASIVGQKLSKFDALEAQVGQSVSVIEELEEQVESLTDERDRERGRADAQEICLSNAELILSDMGYRRDATGDYIRTDKGKKMPPWMNDKEEDGEDGADDESAEGEEEMTPAQKKKMKSKKMDAAEVRVDAKSLMLAWKEADALTGKPLSDQHFDSAETPSDVRRLVVANLQPKLAEKLDSMSDATIDGIYEFIKSQEPTRNDARGSYSGELSSVVSAARSAAGSNQLQQAVEARSATTATAYMQPMSLSR
ncbi:MAG TPA: DUF2213 domain-containing protein [Coleofasciculaceae cyanobacterium]